MTDSPAERDPFVDPSASVDSVSQAPSTMATAVQRNRSVNGQAQTQTTPSQQPQQITGVDAVLNVARNATLTLGTDALIVLDEGLRQRRRAADNFCGLLPTSSSSTTRAISYVNILWASLDAEVDHHHQLDLRIQFAEMTSKRCCRAASITYALPDKSAHAHAETWLQALLDRAYPPGVQRHRRIKVLVNPFGGQGHAVKLYAREIAPIFAAAGGATVDVERTTHQGHAVEIAERLDVDAWDVVACASGDGLPHEVFNGLARQTAPRKALRKVAVVQLPCGSGNAMSLNLNGTDSPSLAALAMIKGVRTPMDLVAITQGDRKYWSFLSQAFGIVAESDLGTDHLRWMGGLRFTWGALVRLLFKTEYPAEISIVLESDDKRAIKAAHRAAFERADSTKSLSPSDDSSPDDALPALQYGTVNSPLSPAFQTEDHPSLGNFYCGNMCWMTADSPFFATALPRDGLADLVTISARISRLTALGAMLSVDSGKFIDHPSVNYRKIRAYRITPRPSPANPSASPAGQNPSVSKRLARWLGGGSSSQQERGGLIDIDGELVPFEPFQAEVVPSLATVLSKRRDVYEFDPLPA